MSNKDSAGERERGQKGISYPTSYLGNLFLAGILREITLHRQKFAREYRGRYVPNTQTDNSFNPKTA